MRRLRQTDRLVTVSYSWRRPVLMQSPCCWLPAASAVQCLADAICLYNTLHVGCSKFRVIIGLRKSRANIGECRRIFCRTYAKRKLTRGIFSSPRAWRINLNGKKLAFSQIRPGNRRYQTSSPAPCCSMVGQFECMFLRRLYLTIMCSITSSTNRKCITYRNADTRGLTTTSSNIHTKFGVVGTGGARDMLADRQTRTCTQTRAA